MELDLAYEGNFNLTIQADLVGYAGPTRLLLLSRAAQIFGRTAMISVSIVKLQGIGRMGVSSISRIH